MAAPLYLPKPKSKKKTSTRSGTEESENPNAKISKSVSHIDSTLMGFTGILNKKQTKNFQKAQEQYQKEQLKFSEETNEGGKDKKTTKKWRKVVDFLFGGLKGFFKAIGKIVASLSLGKATGILGFLLGLFLMLRLGLLDIVIPAALDLLKVLVKKLIGYLPKLVKFLWTLITEEVPKIINTIADALSDALGIESEPLRALVKTLTWVVAGGWALNKVMSLFGGNIFTLIRGMGKLTKILSKTKVGLAAAKYISTALKFIGGGIRALGMALVSNPIGLIILAIIAVLAALYAIWKNASKISDWFDGLYEKFTKLGPKGKALVIALGLLLFPLTMIVLIVVGIAKLFKSIQEKGFVQTLKDIGAWFVNLFEKIEAKIFSLPKPLLAVLAILALPFIGIIAAIKGFVKLIKSIMEVGFVQTMKNIGNWFLDLFSKIKDKIKNITEKVFGILMKVSLPFFLFINGLKLLVKFIKLIKKEGIGNAFKIIIHSVIQTVTSKIVNTFNKVLKKIQPMLDWFTEIGSKFIDMFEPMLIKIKKMASSIGDMFGSILDWIMYKASYIPGVDIDRGKAGSSEEYHLMKYAESAAASESTRALINQYAYGNAEAKMAAASQMTDDQMQLAETFKALHGSAQSLKEFSADLNKNKGGLLSKATKKFNTSVNSTSEQSSGKR